MLRKFLGGLVVLLVCVGFVLADEAKGKFKSSEKGKVTVVIDGKEKTFKTVKGWKVYKGSDEVTGKDKGKLLKGLKDGDEVTVVFEKDELKELKVK
jgi:hypothetical protein